MQQAGPVGLAPKIEDLAASLTAITKEQMEDFAMLDINDIFAYEESRWGQADRCSPRHSQSPR